MSEWDGLATPILVAEDDDTTVRFLRPNLEKAGFAPHIVTSGKEALALAPVVQPAVIVLDVGLPDMSGFEVCRLMKEDGRIAEIPILFLTGHSGLDDRVTGLQIGAQDYLPKPFQMAELEARLRAIVRSRAETEEQRDQLAKKNEELMAIINHELRAPLTVISMASQILAERQISEQRREHLVQSIRSSATSLTHIIDDLLFLANPARRLGTCHMRPLVLGVVESSRPLVHEHGLHIAARVPQDLPVVVADEQQMRRALHHLIDNAVKFTPRGGIITITVAVVQSGVVTHGELKPGTDGLLTPPGLLPEGDDQPWLLIVVRDTGIGIAPEHHRRIFEPFYQVDSSSTRVAQGLGLGLAVVATVMRSHNGHLSIRSSGGMGTEIHLAMPVQPARIDLLRLAEDQDEPEGA
jgi:two-component system, sensor histidine kinase